MSGVPILDLARVPATGSASVAVQALVAIFVALSTSCGTTLEKTGGCRPSTSERVKKGWTESERRKTPPTSPLYERFLSGIILRF